jgi:pimeloyl-ACP methyl ester carboxylesterase
MLSSRGHEVEAVEGADLASYRSELEQVVRPDSVVVAHSWGSLAASHLRCQHIVLVTPAALARPLPACLRPAVEPAAFAIAAAEAALLALPAPRLHRMLAAQMGSMEGESLAAFTAQLTSVTPRMRAQRFADVTCVRAHRPRTGATVVVAGRDRVTRPRRVRKLARAWQLPTVELDTSGHCVALESPEQLVEIIERSSQAPKLPMQEQGKD